MNKRKKEIKITKKIRTSIIDVLLICLCNALLLLLLNFNKGIVIGWKYYVFIPIVMAAIQIFFQYLFKLDKTMWEYANSKSFIILMLVTLISAALTLALTMLCFGYDFWLLPYFGAIFFICFTALLVEKMCILQIYYNINKRKNDGCVHANGDDSNNTLIIGAGWTGGMLAKEFLNKPDIFKPVCFLDDDVEKINQSVLEIPVVGTTKDILSVVDKYNIKKIVFAIPSCDTDVRKRIINICMDTKCQIKVVPPLQELVDNSGATPEPRDVRIGDLLGREPMVFDKTDVNDYIKDKVCLVTGGGGSIGSELCRQIASFAPKKLIILDLYENNAYDIQQELVRSYGNKLDLHVEICSIADYERCKILFDKYRPQIVFHAAAHKHVPLMETVPEQAIKNNVVGTLNLCKLATEFKVQKFVLISTDKAVNPTNVMGASKRCCEMIVKYHAQRSKDTAFCAVRFGNVLGSNGSVIPLFKRQIAEGGPITLTDKKIIRYFMTIPEAVSLVLETGVLSKSGEIFVLDMGEPIKIIDLAENMIKLSGFIPYKDIQIVETGLRPGEKLFEELLIEGEGMTQTSNKKIFVHKQIDINEEQFIVALQQLIEYAQANNVEAVLAQLKVLVPTFKHNCKKGS
ncbi:MAG: nucleoside-diphosphate sugar epimerase/dehydratase [Clostridia bacterium]